MHKQKLKKKYLALRPDDSRETLQIQLQDQKKNTHTQTNRIMTKQTKVKFLFFSCR